MALAGIPQGLCPGRRDRGPGRGELGAQAPGLLSVLTPESFDARLLAPLHDRAVRRARGVVNRDANWRRSAFGTHWPW